jgi:hypothetical protein
MSLTSNEIETIKLELLKVLKNRAPRGCSQFLGYPSGIMNVSYKIGSPIIEIWCSGEGCPVKHLCDFSRQEITHAMPSAL